MSCERDKKKKGVRESALIGANEEGVISARLIAGADKLHRKAGLDSWRFAEFADGYYLRGEEKSWVRESALIGANEEGVISARLIAGADKLRRKAGGIYA